MTTRLAVLMLASVPLAAGARVPAAQAPQPAMPHVIAADVPQYPRGAAQSGQSGTFSIGLQTDGQRVTNARLNASAGESPVLREAALANVRTWRFTPHSPTGVVVFFRFTIVDR